MIRRIGLILEMIKFEHSIFALPFAFMGAFFASRGLPSLACSGWILLAMVGARSAAMAFNRIVDARFDASNPRTAGRALVTGALKKGEVVLFTLASAALFVFAAAMLNRLAFILSFPALAVLFFYSYTKRFTLLAHLVLGVCLGFAAPAGWIAVTGTVGTPSLVLGLGVALWVAGFDLIYACQDVAHDRLLGLHSLPARFGLKPTLVMSALLHAAAFALFCLAGAQLDLAWPYWIGQGAVFVSLVIQHAIVKPGDLSKINAAFFTSNGIISLVMAAATLASFLV
jgi:4-hydroxybenzoate polyprenyltransferase